MLEPADSHQELYQRFQWHIPERYNIARDVCDRHAAATPEAPALIYENGEGHVRTFGFRDIQGLANRAANLLAGHRIGRGDLVAILLGQCPETAIVHLACWKLGAISLPLFTLFGEEALEYRLNDSGAKAVITDRESYPKIAAIRDKAPALIHVFLSDGAEAGAVAFWPALEAASDRRVTADTGPDDPALLTYTSGTTGPPKGALHGHRTMLGHMPGFDILMNFFGFEGNLAWSPADWAWIAGLMDVLMPTWWHGKPVLAFRAKGPFDPELACHMMAKHKVRNTLFVPTMLRLMRQVANPPRVRLRSMLVGGEPVGAELHAWGREHFGIALNEGYGQTECNLTLCHNPTLMSPRIGSLGRAVPGHVAAVVDGDGNELPPGSDGELAFKAPNPVMLLKYWRNPEATKAKFAQGWLLTGDAARRDEDGYFWFIGRTDDVITTSGYRVGPGEIEDCLARHPAVSLAAAIGVPDPVRTEAIKVFIVPAPGIEPSEALAEELRAHVRERLARHEYPREIAFIDQLPTTATGKVMRRVLKARELERRAGQP